MKRTVRMVVAAGWLLAFVGAGAAIRAQTTTPDPVEYLTRTKAVFEQACGVCHALERPLSKTFDQAGWEKTVERMHDNRAQVVAYLLTKNTFEAKCSGCHDTDLPLGKSKSALDWLSTVQSMSGKQPGHLTDAEVADIAAYISITRPLP